MRLRAVISCTLLIVAFASASADAALRAFVDRATIAETDTFELVLRSTADSDESPDFRALEADFDILATSSASQISSINGNVQAVRSWVLRLSPRRAGELEIPPLTVAGERSQPIRIVVKPLAPEVRRTIDELVFFESEHTPASVYVQSQLVITRRLFYADGGQLYGEIPAEPDVEHAVVHALGDTRAYTEMRNGRRYGVLEQRYAVFPERSGPLVIPPASVSGSVRLAMEPGGVPRRTGVRVSSQPIRLEVLPVPPEYPKDEPWLPASEVEIVEAWQDEPPALRVGLPATRALIVRVDGNDASAVPPLAPRAPAGVKTYPEPPQQTDTATERGLVGTRTETTSIVPTEAGEIRFPAVTLTWWDTDARQVRTARVPERTLVVAPGPEEPGAAPPSEEAAHESPEAGAPEPGMDRATSEFEPGAPELDVLVWVLLALALISTAGWIWTSLRGRARVQLRARFVEDDPGKAEAHAFQTLARACRQGEPHAVRRALGEWARRAGSANGQDPLRDVQLRAYMNELNRQLYSLDEVQRRYDAAPLIEHVRRLRKRGRMAQPVDEPLPPLYLHPG